MSATDIKEKKQSNAKFGIFAIGGVIILSIILLFSLLMIVSKKLFEMQPSELCLVPDYQLAYLHKT